MIIRSQNKGILLNINGVSSIYVCELTYSDTKNTVFMVKTEKCALGTYSTEEKAIKVLDMIQNAYCRMKSCDVTMCGIAVDVSKQSEDIANR